MVTGVQTCALPILQKDSALLALYRQQAQMLGCHLNERAHTTSFDSVCRLVSAGLGVAILPALSSRRWGRGSGIEVRRLGESWARRPLMLCMRRSVEHTSELQSLMRIAYDFF